MTVYFEFGTCVLNLGLKSVLGIKNSIYNINFRDKCICIMEILLGFFIYENLIGHCGLKIIVVKFVYPLF